jgi:hypothetical protein
VVHYNKFYGLLKTSLKYIVNSLFRQVKRNNPEAKSVFSIFTEKPARKLFGSFHGFFVKKCNFQTPFTTILNRTNLIYLELVI